jgi:hypothetical protein
MKKKTPAPVPVLVRIPVVLLKKLDAACVAQGRSRTSELSIRLTESFKKPKKEQVSMA